MELTYKDNTDTPGDSGLEQLEEDGAFKSAKISEYSMKAWYENGTKTKETISNVF